MSNSVEVRSMRGQSVTVEVRSGAKVHQVAAGAAELLGYAPDVLYALADGDKVLHFEDACPTAGSFELVDTGSAV